MTILDEICESMNLPMSWLFTVEKKAPFSYKSYFIPKKNGGVRQIHQPSRAVKSVQYWLIDRVFCELPVHSAATAYRKNSNIYQNAAAHKSSNYIAKLDFKDFFHSLKERDLELHISQNLPTLSDREVQLIKRICCKKDRRQKNLPGHLTIGSPASPILSNSMLYYFDISLAAYAEQNSLIYTRYADDITLSSIKYIDPKETINVVNSIIQSIQVPSNLSLNTEKTIFLSPAQSRTITGLVITNERKISIGRDKKRKVSSMIHRHTLNKLSDSEKSHLRGLISYIKSVEPTFIATMEKKYSVDALNNIIQGR